MTGPKRIERYDPDYGGYMCRDDDWGEWVHYEDHTAALSTEYARGLRDAAELVSKYGWPGQMSEEVYAALTADQENRMDCADEISRAILALIPPPPGPVAACADTDNKEPTDDAREQALWGAVAALKERASEILHDPAMDNATGAARYDQAILCVELILDMLSEEPTDDR